MLYAHKNGEDFEKSDDLSTAQNQLKDLGLEFKLGNRNFHEDMRKKMNQLLMQLMKVLKM